MEEGNNDIEILESDELLLSIYEESSYVLSYIKQVFGLVLLKYIIVTSTK